MNKKKIMFIHHSGLIGGGSISFYNLWKELKKKYEIVSYVADSPPDFENFLIENNLFPKTFSFRLGKLTYYSGGNSVFNGKFWYHGMRIFGQFKYWKEKIKMESPDLIIVNSKVLCWMVNVFGETKSICFVRETIPGNQKNVINRIMKSMLEKFTLVFFLSEFDLNQTNLDRTKSVVVHDFLDMSKYDDSLGRDKSCEILNVDSKNFNLLFVGGIENLKGIDVLIQAMKILKGKDINLLVAGNDFGFAKEGNFISKIRNIKKSKSIRFSKKIRTEVISNSLEKNVFFLGVQNDISISYSASDAIVFPMKKPHQARPIFEIGVQKKPVIISDFPHIREFVENGENGFLFEPNNPQALAETIEKLRGNKQLLDELGKKNYEKTLQHHTVKSEMKKIYYEIDKILIS